jgi:hypothetical protein
VTEARRIAMWSGPRNISTAMMRAFENRADTAVWDEPFYAFYLKRTGIDHPMAEAIIDAHESDFNTVVARCTGSPPDGARIFYQKHMTHHMLDDADLGWLNQLSHCFLIRHPAFVAASYAKKRQSVTAVDLGFRRQADLFDRVADAEAAAPPVLDAADVLADPAGVLSALCRRLAIPFDAAMLHWPPGARASDGVWGKHWYGAVEKSTEFAAPPSAEVEPVGEWQTVVDACMPHYERLCGYRLAADAAIARS